MKNVSYIHPLTSEDKIKIEFSQDKGLVLKFVVQYHALINSRWRTIMRIDNCHGRPHMHRYYLLRKQLRVELGDSNEEAFTEAKRYIVSGFQKIRMNYLQTRAQRRI